MIRWILWLYHYQVNLFCIKHGLELESDGYDLYCGGCEYERDEKQKQKDERQAKKLEYLKRKYYQ